MAAAIFDSTAHADHVPDAMVAQSIRTSGTIPTP